MAEKISWNLDLMTGERTIDEQHKQIIDLFNELLDWLGQSTVDVRNVRRVLHEIKRYMNTHLEYEEEFMEEKGDPLSPEHRKMHESFISFVEDFESTFEEMQGDGTFSSESLKELLSEAETFLGERYIPHMRSFAKKYKTQ